MKRLVPGLIVLFLGGVSWADPPKTKPTKPATEGRFVPLSPLSLSDLYAKRMRFEEGEPRISVGIMDRQRSATARADGPTRLMFTEVDVPKTVYAPPNSRFSFKPLKTRPAVVNHWAIVSTHDYEDQQGAEEKRKLWQKKGHKAEVFVVGTIVALRGNVLDTRERHVGVGGFRTKKQITALVERLSQKEEVRSFVHEEMVRLPSGTIGVYDERGRLLHRAKSSVYFGTVENGLVELANVEHSRGYASHGRQMRQFWGHVYLAIDRTGALAVVNSVGAERLLKGLVPAEIFATAPIEALKAQAVTARGEIFSKLGHRHFADPFHLCSEQHCQVYTGARFERPTTNEAVQLTNGLLAFRPVKERKKRKLVDSVYSSTCGGFSEANEIVWDTPPSASLRPRIDGLPKDPALKEFTAGLDESNVRAWVEAYPPTECARSSFVNPKKYRWKRTLSAKKLNRMVAKLGVGLIRDLKVLGRGKGGRVTGVRVIGTRRSQDVLREFPVRRLFGNLNSGMFVFDIARNRKGVVQAISFTGGGWGHGVGMCQVGAIGRAERGQTFEQILAHYYNGAVVSRIY